MSEQLTIKEEPLAKVMSDISERCYCAGWIQNLEYVLWDAVLNGVRPYGRDKINQRDIDTLKWLISETKSWIVYETAISLNEWSVKYDHDTTADTNLIKF